MSSRLFSETQQQNDSTQENNSHQQTSPQQLKKKQKTETLSRTTSASMTLLPHHQHHPVDQDNKLDLGLYSRQLYVLGLETMSTLSKVSVLISGMSGLGVEIAKNVILAGPKRVVIHDTEETKPEDLGSQFYLTNEDLGKNRALASVQKLAQLNPYVTVQARTEPLSEELVSEFQVVLLTENKNSSQLIKLNEYCHKHEPSIAFIVAEVRGLFTNIFVDFGDSFTVKDPDGEEYPSLVVTSITNSNPAVVTVHDDKENRIYFQDDTKVVFDGVTGIDIDNTTHFTAKVKGPYTFEINLDTSNSRPYSGSGLVKQVKQTKQLTFSPLQKAWETPGEFVITDFAKFERPPQLHIGFRALQAFRDQNNGELPAFNNEEHATQLVQLAKKINDEAKSKGHFSVETIDEELIKKLSMISRASLAPMNAFVGGIAAQEILKITGKFHPIHQWFYFDAIECLPSNIPVNEKAPHGSRYDDQIQVFGKAIQDKLGQLKLFLVGAGALGCELLKNFAMMGIGCDDSGLVYLTDMDTIEKSNLNRQFLFRDTDIGSAKSETAAKAVRIMNDEINIKSFNVPVGPTTEDTFHQEFWGGLDLVVNALDNVTARLYVDSMCVSHKKPLLESGTLSTKANTQVVIPHKTESYGSSPDPPEKSIPICTLKNFPYAIEHTIQWARDLFEGCFTNSMQEVENYLKDSDYVSNLKKTQKMPYVQRLTLENIKTSLQERPWTFEKCVSWARKTFEDIFSNKLKQLLFNFPKDYVDSNGAPFWSGPKRAPTPLTFDPEDSLHLNFIIYASNLLAACYNVKERHVEPDYFKKVLSGIKIEVFEPKRGVKIQVTENQAEGGDDDEEAVEKIIAALPEKDKLTDFTVSHQEFEKDDDSNFHIDFVTAASNLRALNYGINIADRNTTKRIAGKIIPAIATTTAMITGLVCLELYKVIQDKQVDQFKNAFVNLALPLFAFSEPIGPAKHTSDKEGQLKCYPEDWTLWDTIEIREGDITFEQLIDSVHKKSGLTIISAASGTSLLYNDFLPKYAARKKMKITDVIKEITKKPLNPHQKFIDISAECEDDGGSEEVDIPVLRVYFA